jgi:hypothetical protein
MRIVSTFAAAAVALGMASAPALAQQQQEGLVNVAVGVEDNVVQVPIGIAAQVCPAVNAAVIAQDFQGTDEVVCIIDQETAAEHNPS